MGKVRVKTVFKDRYFREPEITEYETEKDAQSFIYTCLKWGVGIISCDIIKDDMKDFNGKEIK